MRRPIGVISGEESAEMGKARSIDFWFDFASTYSYLAAARIADFGGEEAAAVRWRPMLFGAILHEQGFKTSPFNTQPAKSRHMWRDVERRAVPLGIHILEPKPFPQGSLYAARVMLVGLDQGWGKQFAMQVFAAEFERGLDIASTDVLADCVRAVGVEADQVLVDAQSDAIKQRLKADTGKASAAGVFGAPTFVVDGELFWGDDRFDEALAWLRDEHPWQHAARSRLASE